MAKVLPKEIASLIHHITLNEQGWWDKTIQRLKSRKDRITSIKLKTISNIKEKDKRKRISRSHQIKRILI